MFLRSLTLRGFKSFADKSTLEFTPGISVIVGPNGSGKSNIVDAISWVLGEQGPRALRGGQMTDVIFAGSPGRAPLGMAEARLVIDNGAGLIPLPVSELEISRAVFRSGESEYRMGGRPCRLLDIQELLSDSGIGRALHTIVGQGQLDEVLAARPEERRQFVEEAAGIAKHRRRRERAERKLAGLQGDLVRLQDLVGELRRQLKPLRQQAELAKRHEALTEEAAELARKLAAARLCELLRERDARRPSWEEIEALRSEARTRLEDLDREIARLDGERSTTEDALREAEERHASAQREKSGAEAALRVAMRRVAEASERMTAASGRSGRLFALEDELKRTERACGEIQATLDGRQGELETAEAEYRGAEQARREAEAERTALSEEAAAGRAQAEALQSALAGHEAELQRLEAVAADVRRRRQRNIAAVADLEGEIERLDERETPLSARQSALDRERSDLSRRLGDLQAEEKVLTARQESVEAWRGELAESPAQSFARLRPDRALGVLVDLIDAPADLGPPLRAALGPLADAVVYANRDKAIEDAASDGAGGLTLALARDPGSAERLASGVERDRTLSIPGERPLIDLVRPDPRVMAVAAGLLDGIYLVSNWAEAAAKSWRHPGESFATRDGLLVGPHFVRAAGGPNPRLARVRREAGAIERSLAAVRRGLREGRQRLAEIGTESERTRQELERIDGVIASTADRLVGVKQESASLRREEQLVAERMAAVQASVQAARAQLADARRSQFPLPSLPPIAQPPVPLRVEVEALRREHSRLMGGVARIKKEIDELACEDPAALREVVASAEAERGRAEEALRRSEGALHEALVLYRTATERVREVRTDSDRVNRAWREQSTAAERIRLDHEEEDRARVDLERRVSDAQRLLREGHGAEPSRALEELTAADTAEELARRADLNARRLSLLGRVNMLAAGELGSLQERHDFLVRQLEDVKAARRDLEEVIRAVDQRIRELFEAAFRDVATEYSALFAQLFPGGEGTLRLVDPTDPLVSGIEMEARPGRKRVRRLSLLSGGERSLAALAFLFAIFKARPSPFYLMDEVEAALDDVNLHRFLEVVRGLAQHAQILLVTHQKRTMEIADVLYGVSMSQGGASTVISQRLAGVAAG